jgi:hypothetical protein
MDITFVHGRAQGGRSSNDIRDQWYAGLAKGFQAIGKAVPPKDQIAVPFYGDELDRHTDAAQDNAWDIVFRAEEPDQDPGGLREFESDFLDDIREQLGITKDEIEAEMDKIEAEMAVRVRNRAPWNWEWVQALGRIIDRRVPAVANVVVWGLTKDVRTYLTKLTTRRAIHGIVQPNVEGGPRVIVAHSLGSVVSYWLLNDLGTGANVPLFITAGSPLGVHSVKKRLDSLGKPAGVQKWLNVADPRDPVALREILDQRHGFPADIENIDDISNPRDDPHSIAGYLSDPRVAEQIAAVL